MDGVDNQIILLHPYTKSLISAIPIPDPLLEKNKALFTYNPKVHEYNLPGYEGDAPTMHDIGHGHLVYGNEKEIAEYKKIREAGVPIKSITILKPGEEATKVELEENEVPQGESILDIPVHDTGSAWYAFGSFLLPILGIVGWIVFKHIKYYRNFKACRKGTIISLSIIGAVIVLFLLFLLLSII